MPEENSQYKLRCPKGYMTNPNASNPDDCIPDPNYTGGGSGDGADIEGILGGIGALLGGAAPLVTSISNAAQGGNTTTQPTQTNYQPSPAKKTSPALIIGGIAAVLLIIGLIIYMSNGRSSKPKS